MEDRFWLALHMSHHTCPWNFLAVLELCSPVTLLWVAWKMVSGWGTPDGFEGVLMHRTLL